MTRVALLPLLLLGLWCLAGCGGRAPGVRLYNPNDAAWATLPAYLVLVDDGVGSAFPWRDARTLLTAYHVVAADRAIGLHDRGDHEPVGVAVLSEAAGGRDLHQEARGEAYFRGDWQVVDVGLDLPRPPLAVDIDRTVSPGETVLLAGWVPRETWQTAMLGGFREGEIAADAEWVTFVPVHILAQVTDPPSDFPGDTAPFIFCRTFNRLGLHGMSGGPAAVWDDDDESWVVVGIHIGFTWDQGLFGLGRRRYSVIHRLDDIFAALTEGEPSPS